MNTPITLDIRCGNCNKKLSEIVPPVTLMIQRIKCPRCGEIVETYVIKPTADNGNHKPKEKPIYKPQETQIIKPDETKQGIILDNPNAKVVIPHAENRT